MKEGSGSGRRCYSCRRYKCYYTKGLIRFNRERTGLCVKNKRVTKHMDTCEHWQCNTLNRPMPSASSINALYETIAALTELAEIIKEDIEHKHIKHLAKERLERKLDEIESENNN